MGNNFVGQYVEEIRDVLVAASASGLHTQLVGPPGCGKTSIALSVLSKIYGDKTCMTRFNPTTPPSKVEGVLDYSALLGENSVWRLITDGTPYHPGMLSWLADEWTRANEAVEDMFVDVLDRWDIDKLNSPVVVGTANFIPAKSERAKAVLDRFAMTMWISPPVNGTKDVARAQLLAGGANLEVPGTLPSLDEVMHARKCKLTKKAIDAVAQVVDEIAKTVSGGLLNDSGQIQRQFSHQLNHRRITYWTRLLASTTTLYAGTEDFDAIHPKAMEAMASCWTSTSAEEYADWRTLIGTVVDPITAIVESALTKAFQTMKEKASGKSRIEIAQDLGKVMQDALSNLSSILDPFDERYLQAQADLQGELSKYMRGEYDTD